MADSRHNTYHMANKCQLCARGGCNVRHRHYSSMAEKKTLQARGRRAGWCGSCRQVHSLEHDENLPRRVVLTSSTLSGWRNMQLPVSTTPTPGCWETVEIPGATFEELTRAIIIEISSVQSPVYLIVAGGTFNSVMRYTEAAVVKASMYALLGVIGAQTVKYPNFPSKLMISQMFSPPSFSYRMLERLNVFNSLACEMNSICGFPALPDPNSVIKFEGSPGAGQGGWYWMANGQLIDREAFRERKPLRMIHLNETKKGQFARMIIDHFERHRQ